jgi:phosphohistidine phosphatase SixA
MKPLIKVLILSLLLLGLFPCRASAQPAIFIVRHAEEETTNPSDPDLSVAGRARARRLAAILRSARLSRIFVTDLARTKQTGAAVAGAYKHLVPTVVPANDSAGLLTSILAAPGNVLVVGHSNTIPGLIKGLGVTGLIEIRDDEYDNLFVVLRSPTPHLIRLHYP